MFCRPHLFLIQCDGSGISHNNDSGVLQVSLCTVYCNTENPEGYLRRHISPTDKENKRAKDLQKCCRSSILQIYITYFFINALLFTL